ncbi:MAG: DNA-directed DNA polymerase [Candidatus Methanofastidiosia archaeon]
MIIYDCDYIAMGERTVVRLYVREGDSNKIIYDDSHEPYIYAEARDPDASAKIADLIKVSNEKVAQVVRVEDVKRVYQNKERDFLKIFFRYPFDVPELRDEISKYAKIFEYDIPYVRRYLLDKSIPILTPVNVHTEERDKKEYFIDAVKTPAEEPQLKVMSLDIETYCVNKGMPDAKKDPIIMVSVAIGTDSKVFCWKKSDNAEVFKDEKSMMEGFLAYLDEFSPQVIVTYNGDNFDFPYIKKRGSMHGISHPFVTHMKIQGRGQHNRTEVPGMVHIDLFPIVRKNINLSRYKLENVYKEHLGKDKSDIEGSKIWQYWDDPSLLDELVLYSKEDAVATYEIGEQMLPLAYELTKIVNQRPFDVSRASSSSLVEWLLIRRCHENGEIIPNPPSSEDLKSRYRQTYEGAYVVEPMRGIHDNIFYFDFRSLYPSIIISHNIDPNTIDCDCCVDNMSPTGHCFCKKREGFIPSILEGLLKERMRIKEKMKGKTGLAYKSLYGQQWALKILANSFYGYLGYPRSRWYSKESAESITAWGRKYINSVIDAAKERGFDVVYGDTDSLFVRTPVKDEDKARQFLDGINTSLPGSMELELEGFYKRGVFVTKKKYALIDEDNKIITKGLEVVRRDWTGIAKKTQEAVISKILKEGDIKGAIDLVQNVTRDIKENKVPIEDLVINTQITMPLSQYKAIGPHVKIAKELKEKGEDVRVGTIVSYLVLKGSGLIRDKVVPVSEYKGGALDTNYYIKNQVLPAVKRILEPLGYKEDDMEYNKSKQSSLEKWF